MHVWQQRAEPQVAHLESGHGRAALSASWGCGQARRGLVRGFEHTKSQQEGSLFCPALWIRTRMLLCPETGRDKRRLGSPREQVKSAV